MPCYNEERIAGYSIRRLINAFTREGYVLELVAVDNGSRDGTGEIIRGLAADHPEIVHVRVESNRGYGYGIRQGYSSCTSAWVGHIPADSQVDADDVVRLFEAALISGEKVLAKVRRRFRMDGVSRRVVTLTYNTLIRVLWPRLSTFDVNAVPKIFPREFLDAFKLESDGWAIDPEIIVKSYHLRTPVLEFNIMSRQRGGGTSHVRVSTATELFWSLIELRFSGKLRQWKEDLRRSPAVTTPSAEAEPT